MLASFKLNIVVVAAVATIPIHVHNTTSCLWTDYNIQSKSVEKAKNVIGSITLQSRASLVIKEESLGHKTFIMPSDMLVDNAVVIENIGYIPPHAKEIK